MKLYNIWKREMEGFGGEIYIRLLNWLENIYYLGSKNFNSDNTIYIKHSVGFLIDG